MRAFRLKGWRVGDVNFGYLLKLETVDRGAVVCLGAGLEG